MQIILIGGEKGGTAKTTTSLNLAVALALEKCDVMVLDADPQGTATKWASRRDEAGLLPKIHSVQKTGDVRSTVADLAQRYDYLIIDAGGRDSKELRTAMLSAQTMYIPVKASQADLETLPHMDDLIATAKEINPTLKAKILLSMAPTNPAITEVKDAQDALADFENFSLSEAIIRERIVYRTAMAEGKGILELGDAKAKQEFLKLLEEIKETNHG